MTDEILEEEKKIEEINNEENKVEEVKTDEVKSEETLKSKTDNKETTVNKKDNKVESRAAIYGEGNVLKTLFMMTLPILVLMLTNTLYQLIDSAIAANMVEYGFGDKGQLTGSVVTMICMPVMLIMMAAISLTNIGFGTIFSQRLGQRDEEGAKKAISTMHLTNIIIIILGMTISFLFVKPWLNYMGIDMETIGQMKVVGGSMTLFGDAILAMVIYAIAIGLSSFQGILSRQIRAEGHIKASAYLPLISIPINIAFDLILMGPANMGASGAAIATLIATLVTTGVVIGYTTLLSRKGETYFSWTVFMYGVDWKLFGIMVAIGIAPFTLQIGRAYNQILSMHLLQNIGSLGALQLMSSVQRPMMLIMMPVFAIIQTSGSMIGYNYGAKDDKRVTGTILSAFLLVFLFAIPQYVLIMAWPQSMFWLFGAKNFVWESTVWIDVITNETTHTHVLLHMNEKDALLAYYSYMSLSILVSFPVIMIIYYLSTKKVGYAMLQTFISFFLVFTIVILSFYNTIGQHIELISVDEFFPDGSFISGDQIYVNPDLHLFFLWYPVWILTSQLLAWPLFIFVRWKDRKALEDEEKKAAHRIMLDAEFKEKEKQELINSYQTKQAAMEVEANENVFKKKKNKELKSK